MRNGTSGIAISRQNAQVLRFAQDDRLVRGKSATSGKLDQCLQLCGGCPGVNRPRRQRHRIPQVVGSSRGDQRSSGVEQDDIAVRADFFPSRTSRISEAFSGASPPEMSSSGVLCESKLLRSDLVGMHTRPHALPQFVSAH